MTKALHFAIAALIGLAEAAAAAPRLPESDAEVVERLPTRLNDPVARELAALRAQWRANPRDADAAVRLARRYIEEAGARGDPRYVGYAQATLGPWWAADAPPVDVRVQRAVLHQFEHRFDDALADLNAAVAAQPGHGEAWAWLAAIHMVRAAYDDARRACTALAPLAPPVIGVACQAYVDAMTGQADRAAAALHRALQDDDGANPAQRLWVLTRLAETEERRGAFGAAESAFREALALGIDDVYLRAAYADFLLDRGRPADVLALLKDGGRADVLLLRLALAAQALGEPAAAGWTQELAARFDAARARGDVTHRKEEARFVLRLRQDPDRALALAQANYAQQRELADARLLLEAAIAAGRSAAAAPVLDWMAASGVESVVLRDLTARLKGRP